MRTICEVIVQDILPTLRAAIARELITAYNLNQGDAAKLLNVSQPAVSQYLRQLRGKSEWTENEIIRGEIKKLCNELHSKQINNGDLGTRMCTISKTVIDNGLIRDLSDYQKVDKCVACT